MSKKLVILFVLLSFISLFPDTAQAVTPDCSSVDISYTPNAFLANPSNLTLNFAIQSTSNTLKTLSSKPVRLRLWSGGFYVTTNSINVTGNAFSINALDIDNTSIFRDLLINGLKRPQTQKATLQWKPDPSKDFVDFCTNVNYSIADPDTCLIDPSLQKNIPLAQPIIIKFSGKPNSDYTLQKLTDTGATSISTAKTGNDGQGSFNSVIIPGDHGDSFDIIITTSSNAIACRTPITLLANAAPAPPPPAGPVAPPPLTAPTAQKCDDTDANGKKIICASGGGETCPDDGRGPALKTAIGCIHTSPPEFVKDLMKFVIGIGGGLAFLMMLLGAYQMLSSAGNPETLKAGQDRLTSAVIGLLFIIFSVLLLQIIGIGILNIPGFK